MLRLGAEMMTEADSPRAASLALVMALVERGGGPTAEVLLGLGQQLPVSFCSRGQNWWRYSAQAISRSRGADGM